MRFWLWGVSLLLADVAGLERQAFRAYQQRDWAEAVRLYDAYHGAAAGTPSSYDNLGVALTSLGRLRQAEAALRKAVQMEPQHRWAYNHLGFVLREQGRVTEGIEMFERQIRISPQDPYAYRNLAGALAQEGRFEEAEAVAAEHERRTYERGAVYIDLACALNSRRNPEQAKKYLEQARAAGVERSLLAQETAHYYLALGDLPRAEEQYRKLAGFRPQDPIVALRLGALYFQMDRLDQAAAAFAKVISVDAADRVTLRLTANTSKTVPLAELRARPGPGPLGDLPVDLGRAALLVRARERRGPACAEFVEAEKTAVAEAWCR
jgi:tetratricopeptide (TPR) repeat protein